MKMPVIRPISFPRGLSSWKTIFSYTRKWEVVEDYYLEIPNHPTIVVPKGFWFDGASIPKIFRNILSPIGALLIPGLIHDFGYRYNYLLTHYFITDIGHNLPVRYMEKVGKDAFDDLFLEIANHVNGLSFINKMAYLAVKYFGNSAWKSHWKTQV